MSLHITDQAMTCDVSGHTARPAGDGWELSWLPGRVLGRDQAISGLTLAEETAAGAVPGDARWPLIGVLAAELGLTADNARAQVAACRELEASAAPGDEWEAGL